MRWTYQRDNVGFFSSPAVVGNRVYVTSAELGAFSQSGSIFCFDADTGAVVWNSAPKNYRPTFSSPAPLVGSDASGGHLMDTTIGRRRQLGDVRVFDPGGFLAVTRDSGVKVPPEELARWSPLRNAHTATGAKKAGEALAKDLRGEGEREG